MSNDWIVIIVGLVVLFFILAAFAGCVYRYSITDMDCWLATDPIICQKIKDGVK